MPAPQAQHAASGHAGAAATTTTAPTTSPSIAAAATTAAAPTRCCRAQRALVGNGHPGRHGVEVQHFADEVAQRAHQCRGLDVTARDHGVGGLGRQPQLFGRAQQDHVGARSAIRRTLTLRPLSLPLLSRFTASRAMPRSTAT